VDYHLLTPGIRNTILDGWIDGSTRFSDHAPVIMDYDIEIGF
jgi:exodeoxyribonuclease-3